MIKIRIPMLFVLFICHSHILQVLGYASYMCKTQGGINWCSTINYMLPNANLATMGNAPTIALAYDTHTVQVLRGTTALVSGVSTYTIPDSLTIKIGLSGIGYYEVVYQAVGVNAGVVGTAASPAKFSTTSCCTGTRQYETVNTSPIGKTFTISTGASGDIQFWAVWSQQVGTQMTFATPVFTLKGPSLVTSAPSYTPSQAPTYTITPPPSSIPSQLPSALPTSTAVPTSTAAPTFTSIPTVAGSPTTPPSSRPSVRPTRIPTVSPSKSSTPTKMPAPPTILPTGMPSMNPTLHSDRYTVTCILHIQSLSLMDFYNNQNTFKALTSNGANVDTKQVFVAPYSSTASGTKLAAKVSRSMQKMSLLSTQNTSTTISAAVTGLSSLENANLVHNYMTTYFGAQFLVDMQIQMPSVTGSNLLVSSVNLVSDSIVPMSYTCQLSSQTSLSWMQIDTSTIRMRLSINNEENWVSAGVIKPAFLMYPDPKATQVRHNVFIFSPLDGMLGRFYMDGLTAADMKIDTSIRLLNSITNVQKSPRLSYIEVDLSSKSESDAIPLNINGVNYITWANGGQWPSIHTDYGFIEVNWQKGYCTNIYDVGLSPYYIFLIPAAAILFARTPYLKKNRSINFIINRRVFPLPHAPLFHEYSMGGFVLILGYFVIILFVFWTSLGEYPELTTAITATGKVALMSFWMALLPSSKTSLFTWLTTVPFERSIKYHKNVVSIAMIASFIHLALTWYKSQDLVVSGDYTYWRRVVPLYGVISLIAFSSMVVFAFEPIRRARYEIFLLIHQIYPIGIIFLIFHVNYAWFGFLPGALFHIIDILTRLYAWICPTKATISCRDDIVCLVIRGNYAKYKPGCYYFINIPEISLFQWHPFSVSHTSPFCVRFHIKSTTKSNEHTSNSWTRQLYNKVEQMKSNGERMQVTTFYDGPYGSIALNLPEYSYISILVGGIGITPMIALCEYIRYNRLEYHQPLNIDVHWSMRNITDVNHFSKRMLKLLNDSETEIEDGNSDDVALKYSPVPIRFNLYLTSAGVPLQGEENRRPPMVNRDILACKRHPNCTIKKTRPDLHAIMNEVRMSSTTSSSGLIAGWPVDNNTSTDAAEFGTPHNSIKSMNFKQLSMSEMTFHETAPNSKRRGCLLICGPREMTIAASKQANLAGIDFHTETFSF